MRWIMMIEIVGLTGHGLGFSYYLLLLCIIMYMMDIFCFIMIAKKNNSVLSAPSPHIHLSIHSLPLILLYVQNNDEETNMLRLDYDLINFLWS